MFAQGYNNRANKEYILSQTSEEYILSYYTGINKVPCVTNSPLREDKHPSFGVYYSTNGINFIDYTTQESGSLYDLLMLMFKLDFYNCLNMILKDLPNIGYCQNNFIYTPYQSNREKSLKLSKKNNLKVKVRKFKDYDIKFWEQFGIREKTLIWGDVYAISHIFITKNNKEYVFPADKYAYVYVEFKDNIESLKIYQPFSINHKWINNHDASVWDLWTKLPKSGELCILTSSRKDALCIIDNMNIPSTSMQAEGYIPKVHVINELCDRFNVVGCLYDNDFDKNPNPGIEFSNKLCSMFKLKQIIIPDEYKSKDPSDLYKNHGKEKFKEIMSKLIYEIRS